MNTFRYRNLKKDNYFEGWYLRVTDEDNDINIAFIFAITKDINNPHAFIQVYDGVTLVNNYYKFDINDFEYKENTVYIKDNYLSLEKIHLDVGSIRIDATLQMSENLSLKQINKSAMSYISKFPLECFQEVNIIDGNFNGEMKIEQKSFKISGKTYMEKTYGNKFPQSWIWIQCNHFDKDAALTFAYGKIPILKWKVKGFFAIVNINGIEYRFASYNFAKLKLTSISETKTKIILKRGFYRLVLIVDMIKPVKLVGPLENGEMNLDVFESINSKLVLSLYKRKELVLSSTGKYVGYEKMI